MAGEVNLPEERPPGWNVARELPLDETSRRKFKNAARRACVFAAVLTAATIITAIATGRHGDSSAEAASIIVFWMASMSVTLLSTAWYYSRRVSKPFALRAGESARCVEIKVRRHKVSKDQLWVRFRVTFVTAGGVVWDRVKLPMSGIEWRGCTPESTEHLLLELPSLRYSEAGTVFKRVIGNTGIVRIDPSPLPYLADPEETPEST